MTGRLQPTASAKFISAPDCCISKAHGAWELLGLLSASASALIGLTLTIRPADETMCIRAESFDSNEIESWQQ